MQDLEQQAYNIGSTYSEVSALMATLREFFVSQNLVREDYGEIELCLVEALNNVVRHSYNGEPGHGIGLSVAIGHNTAYLVITDKGTARTNFDEPTLDFDPDDIDNLPEGGMGLYIISKIMDSTSYQSDGKTNTFSMQKRLRARPESTA